MMIHNTAKEILEQAKDDDGNISVFNFDPLYKYGYYLVEGKILLDEVLASARMILIDVKLPMNDIDNLLELVGAVEND